MSLCPRCGGPMKAGAGLCVSCTQKPPSPAPLPSTRLGELLNLQKELTSLAWKGQPEGVALGMALAKAVALAIIEAEQSGFDEGAVAQLASDQGFLLGYLVLARALLLPGGFFLLW